MNLPRHKNSCLNFQNSQPRKVGVISLKIEAHLHIMCKEVVPKFLNVPFQNTMALTGAAGNSD